MRFESEFKKYSKVQDISKALYHIARKRRQKMERNQSGFHHVDRKET